MMKQTSIIMMMMMILVTVIGSVVEQQHVLAFPCAGGTGKEYCRGYHSGSLQALKDDSSRGPRSGTGGVFTSTCPSGHTAEYCNGWTRGYDDESQQLD